MGASPVLGGRSLAVCVCVVGGGCLGSGGACGSVGVFLGSPGSVSVWACWEGLTGVKLKWCLAE